MASRHRPRRGPAGSNILVTGDVGTTAGPQGGAKPGPSESGDLDAREFGVPQADIPGGLRHVVNPETKSSATAARELRPADEHKYHGVPPMDFGQYEDVPGVEHDKPERPAPEPKYSDAVAVYTVERPDGTRMIRTLVSEGPLTISASSTSALADPERLLNRDPRRTRWWIFNETANGNPRIGTREDVSVGRGLKLLGTAYSPTFESQDEVWVVNTSTANAATLSLAWETEVPASGA